MPRRGGRTRQVRGWMMVADLDLLGFIRRCIPSVWALDVLLLVRQSGSRSWSAGDLVSELRASESLIVGTLERLEKAGLLAQERDGRFRFAPAGEAIEQLTMALADAYAERPVAVINAIVSVDSKLETLANAFRFTPPKP